MTKRLLVGCLLLSLLTSCQPGPIGPAASTTTPVAAGGIGVDSPVSAPAGDEGQLVEETWDAYSMQGVRVGYAQTAVFKLQEGDQEVLRTRQYLRMAFSREGQLVRQEVTMTSWESPDGRLLRFESRMAAGTGEMVSRGRVEGSELVLEVGTLGRTQTQRQPWQPDWGGPFAVEQSMRRQPLKPGEKRSVRGLTILNTAGDTQLEAGDYEEVALPTGTVRLLRVHGVAELAGQRIEHDQWVNERGESLKMIIPAADQQVVRTTKEEALRSTSGSFDLMASSVVPVSKPVSPTSKQAVYRAQVKSGVIARLFAEGLSQRVKPLDDATAEITVFSVRPDRPTSLDVVVSPPTDADRESGSFVQSDDPLIQQLAASAAGSEQDPWKVACTLEAFVRELIHEKSLTQAFASAAEVARSREGDCTEHAVLLAALCRARGIPARTAFGLIYYAPKKGFAYHMWTEAWIRDRWVPLDATLALGGIGADHIKLGDSNLSGGSPLADLLVVAQLFGRLELDVVSSE